MKYNYIFDLDDDLFQSLQLFSKRVSIAIKEVITCERIGVAVIGLEVPHTHIHLVPINSIGDLNFSKPKLIVSAEEMQAIAMEISKAYDLNN